MDMILFTETAVQTNTRKEVRRKGKAVWMEALSLLGHVLLHLAHRRQS